MWSRAPVSTPKQKRPTRGNRVGPRIGRKLAFSFSVSQRFTRLWAALQPLRYAKSRHSCGWYDCDCIPGKGKLSNPILVGFFVVAFDGRWDSSIFKRLIRELVRLDEPPTLPIAHTKTHECALYSMALTQSPECQLTVAHRSPRVRPLKYPLKYPSPAPFTFRSPLLAVQLILPMFSATGTGLRC